MSLDGESFRFRAARLRERAARLMRTAEAVVDPSIRDGYTALIAEYDLMAYQLDRIADDVANATRPVDP